VAAGAGALSARALVAARLGAQRLTGAASTSPLEATRHLLAVQAQDPRAARLALRVRAGAAHAGEVDHALTVERSLVITWVNRGTLHLVAAEDEPLLHGLTTPQLRSSSERRLREEGVDEAAARRGKAAIVEALTERGPLSREQLRGVLERARVPTAGQALVHVLFSATLDGHLVRGPLIDGEHAFVLAHDWLGERPELDRGHALAELARRYLAAHGPADEHDLVRWARLALRDARAGLAAISSELDHIGGGLVDLRRERASRLPTPRLLGPFDPLLLGWRSRAFVVGEPRVVVTTNGIIRAVALVRGQVAGTWTLPRGRVDLTLWDEPSAATLRALRREAAAVEAFLDQTPISDPTVTVR
jgi:hypothetical protein